MVAAAGAPDAGVAAQPVATRPAPAASRANLFAEPPRAAATTAAQPVGEAARPSLFSTVTGAFRRRQHAPATTAEQPAPVRAEPMLQEARPEQPRASVRQTAGDEVVGLDIPAFLRRQSS